MSNPQFPSENQPKRATLMDVAERSGVSYQTVSRVINHHPKVAKSTRAKVLEAIKELGYHPSFAAQSLAAGRTKTLALITLGVGNYGPASMFYTIENLAHKAGYEIISAYVETNDEASIVTAVDRLRRWMVDGVMLIAPVESENYRTFLGEITDIPVVHVDTYNQPDIHSVAIDQYSGGVLAAQHILSLGHQEIVEITGPMNWFGAQARHQALVDTMTNHGLTLVDSIEGTWSHESGSRCTRELLASGKSFTAMVIGNDHMALGALAALHESGLRVPDDVSVIGFDNVDESPYFIPALTTVEQPFAELGRRSISYLLELLESPDLPPEHIAIPPRLIERASVAAPNPTR